MLIFPVTEFRPGIMVDIAGHLGVVVAVEWRVDTTVLTVRHRADHGWLQDTDVEFPVDQEPS